MRIRDFIKIKNSLILVILLISCKKVSISSEYETNPQTFDEIFNNYWKQMNSKYVFWDIDKTDWDQVYVDYEPKFKNLNINNLNDIKEAQSYFIAMTSSLIDNHYSITFKFPGTLYTSYTPSLVRKSNKAGFHSPYLFGNIDTAYLDNGYIKGSYTSDSNETISILTGCINKSILYLSCNQLGLEEAYFKQSENQVKNALQSFFTRYHTNTANLKGIIIDLRTNAGGDIADLSFILGNLMDKPLLFGSTHTKSNTGRLDFSIRHPAIIKSFNSKSSTLPIVALIDNYTTSAAELLAMAIHSIDSSVIVGETTSGATGLLTTIDENNRAGFNVGNYLNITCSTESFLYTNGNSYEDLGFPPDIAVPFDINSVNIKRDIQLEKAISVFNN